jgi:hypothetical protein
MNQQIEEQINYSILNFLIQPEQIFQGAVVMVLLGNVVTPVQNFRHRLVSKISHSNSVLPQDLPPPSCLESTHRAFGLPACYRRGAHSSVTSHRGRVCTTCSHKTNNMHTEETTAHSPIKHTLSKNSSPNTGLLFLTTY